jgi:hypothetical protein
MTFVRSMRGEILSFLPHVLLAMAGGTCAGIAADAFFLEPLLGGHRRLPNFGVYNPIFWVFGLILGLFVNYRTKNRSARYVWVVGVAYLVFVLSGEHQGYSHAFQLLFSTNCEDGGCLGLLFFTVPFLNSVAYSGGAWFGLRFAQETRRRAVGSAPQK